MSVTHLSQVTLAEVTVQLARTLRNIPSMLISELKQL